MELSVGACVNKQFISTQMVDSSRFELHFDHYARPVFIELQKLRTWQCLEGQGLQHQRRRRKMMIIN